MGAGRASQPRVMGPVSKFFYTRIAYMFGGIAIMVNCLIWIGAGLPEQIGIILSGVLIGLLFINFVRAGWSFNDETMRGVVRPVVCYSLGYFMGLLAIGIASFLLELPVLIWAQVALGGLIIVGIVKAAIA